jgi:ferredoxin
MDAPQPVYEWIATLPDGNGLPVAVIAVSGGGEVWPITSCRVRCIKALERKGYTVNYETMMVMPSNISVATNDHLAMWLLRVLPEKISRITEAILSGKRLRTRFKISSRVLSYVSVREKQNAYRFAKGLRITAACTGCGWCERNCPRNNIRLIEEKPEFADRCIICLRCIYGCPNHAINVERFKLLVNQSGFSLKELEQRMAGVELKPVKECARGIFGIGVRRYLRN